MLDDFIVRALLVGTGIALVTGPFGCFVVWRRMAYFGDTMAHSALLGITLALLFEINSGVGVFIVASLLAFVLILLQRRADLPNDTLLGILSHSTLALGLIIIGLLTRAPVDVMAYLFGDVLAVTRQDLLITFTAGAVALGLLVTIWRPLLAGTVNEELARAECSNIQPANIAFLVLLAAVIAIAIKIVGILLITALLVIPAATARKLANSPESMAVTASVLGVLAVWMGLFSSMTWDTPAGPAIVVSALLLFLVCQIIPVKKGG